MATTILNTRNLLMQRRCFSAAARTTIITIPDYLKTHIIFGSNTDVGKTICSAGLVRASSATTAIATHYMKPLQCGGSDQAFVEKYCNDTVVTAQTLFNFETPASPHLASILENKPTSDDDVLNAVQRSLNGIQSNDDSQTIVWIETAGGVLSPSTASPNNHTIGLHAQSLSLSGTADWGWTTQADLYRPLSSKSSVILVGDGRLGGISATLCAYESLLARDYAVAGILLLEEAEHPANATALREHVAATTVQGTCTITSLPAIPADPSIPLYDWYESAQVSDTFDEFYEQLLRTD